MRRRGTVSRGAAAVLWSAALLAAAAGVARGEALLPQGTLRVCADPNSLPFSNAREEGFENRIASLVAQALDVPLQYEWRPQRRGFIRNTLGAGKCDLVMGVPINYRGVLTTQAYYASSYVFLTRRGEPVVQSLDDDLLRRLRIGVHLVGDDGANTPGAHALGRRGIVDNVVGFSIYGNYEQANPPARLVEAVAEGTVDLAIVWGPYAGYFATKSAVPLHLEPVTPVFDPPGQTFTFGISMAVARERPDLRRRIDRFIEEQRPAIDRILEAYHIPRVD